MRCRGSEASTYTGSKFEGLRWEEELAWEEELYWPHWKGGAWEQLGGNVE